MKRVFLALVVAGFLASGCSVGTDASPQRISPHDVPFGLLKSTTSTTSPAAITERITVFFEGAHHLVTISRVVPAPATLRSALKALGQGPTSAEASVGVLSPVSTAAPITVSSRSANTVVVNVGTSFSALSGQDQIIAAAQLVYTLTLFPGVDQVSIRVGGKPVQMPTATGRISNGPLRRSAYASLAPL